jgi:two-component system response regulator FixJ
MTGLVLLVDDHDAFRGSTQWLLEGLGFDVLAFDSADAVLAAADAVAAKAIRPCVLTDVRMPGRDGLQLHDALIARSLSWPVVYMTGHGDVPLAVAAMRKGAISFLEKPFKDEALEQALREAFSRPGGVTTAAPDPIPGSGNASSALPAGCAESLGRLTPRERQVLDLVVQGRLNKTIADILGISIKTVELHRANMMQKMGARSITDLMRRVLGSQR